MTRIYEDVEVLVCKDCECEFGETIDPDFDLCSECFIAQAMREQGL